MKPLIIVGLLVLGGYLAVSQVLYVVDVTEQVGVVQFGVWKRTVIEPGLQVKTPIIEEVKRFDKRLLRFDSAETEFLTSDKKALVIDIYARWRIANPEIFFQTVVTESSALGRLDTIISSEIREEVASHTQEEIVSEKRSFLMSEVTERSREKSREFGIEIQDVRIKRADFPSEVASQIYARMSSERQREANLLRAEGEEAAITIRAGADLTVAMALAKADQASKEIHGTADAEATKIYAAALSKDPDFYAFVRSLEAYELALDDQTTFVLSSESDLFRFLTSPVGIEKP